MALPGVYKIFNDTWVNQTVWIFSDCHFGDEDLRAGMPGRPSDDCDLSAARFYCYTCPDHLHPDDGTGAQRL